LVPAIQCRYLGNRSIAQSSNLGFSVVAPVSFNPATNQNSGTGWSYDASGNITADPSGATYGYDAENRHISATGNSYTYDGDGRRVQKTTSSQY
jgi:YD repeat-containing protein